MKTISMILLASVLTLAVTACGRGNETQSGTGSSSAPATDKVPASIVLAKAPEGVKTVDQIRKEAKQGDEVVLEGFVGGRKSPFTANRAVMLVVDKGMKNTCTSEADHCPTPWDYCCEDGAALLGKMVSVQVVGADGKPLKVDLKGVGGLKELSEVVIKGKISKKDEAGLVVDASGIFVKGS